MTHFQQVIFLIKTIQVQYILQVVPNMSLALLILNDTPHLKDIFAMNAKPKVQDIGQVQSIDQDIYKLRLNTTINTCICLACMKHLATIEHASHGLLPI